MSRDPLRLNDYLDHILKAIVRIENYTVNLNQASFISNELVQDAVIRNIEIIGEASKTIERVAPQFLIDHPELPLAFAYDMRNLLAHGYFKVDLKIVWKTIENDLPVLKQQLIAAKI